MKRVYSAETLVQVAHMRNLLATYGVATELRNSALTGILGDIPLMETWPQLWVEERLYPLASAIVEQELNAPPAGSAWTCQACGESIEGQFTECWRCAGQQATAGS